MKKITYSVEIECCEEILFSTHISKQTYEHEIKRLKNQVKDTQESETKTELLRAEKYETPLRFIEETTFLRGTTFIIFEKTTYKGVRTND